MKFPGFNYTIDAKVQTEYENIANSKESESTQCNYFSRMEELLM